MNRWYAPNHHVADKPLKSGKRPTDLTLSYVLSHYSLMLLECPEGTTHTLDKCFPPGAHIHARLHLRVVPHSNSNSAS